MGIHYEDCLKKGKEQRVLQTKVKAKGNPKSKNDGGSTFVTNLQSLLMAHSISLTTNYFLGF